ncbi:hypothetical protein MBAV_002080 [Candidatus Magnetobacterium bavaricum]|uniref:Uncharacterized protein n=1 Tax=Candidatus Magnetobacterium bavaricum TaxID=29290 RepID=A0A0F3GV10_9BACT|nr:hypothetical protein MBAV_002080 [Candidatus Magnetobacterium bavaricum]
MFQQHRSLMRNVEDYFCLEELIKQERPDMFITLHEMNPWGKQIGHLAKKHDVVYITLQEGDYYNSLINLATHTEYSMFNLLWGLETRDRLMGHGCSSGKMIIVGNTHIDEAIKEYTTAASVAAIKKELSIPPDKKVVAFLPNTYWSAMGERAAWAALLAGLKRPDIVCVLKWHPQVAHPVFEEIKKLLLELMPTAIVLFGYDPYKVLAVADYCVVMGKTTLGVEALAFRKPLFDLYNVVDGSEFYKDINVAQTVSPVGNWDALFKTMQEGVPQDITQTTEEYLEKVFYRLDGMSVQRAIDVISHVLKTKNEKTRPVSKFAFKKTKVNGKISFIIPTGNDPLAFMATMNSLSSNKNCRDAEYIIVATDDAIKTDILDKSDGLTIVQSRAEERIATIFNCGLEAASGEFLVFILPGVLMVKDNNFMDAIREGIAGIPIYNTDLTPFRLASGTDFNFTPKAITEAGKKAEFVVSLLFGVNRDVFESLGGFDKDTIFFAVELCLLAREKGYKVTHCNEDFGILFKTCNYTDFNDFRYHAGDWKRSVNFFARWYAKLQKDDDFLSYAKDMLKETTR